jgi:hypothetical protein
MMDFLPDFDDPEVQLLIMMIGGGLLLAFLVFLLFYQRLRGRFEINKLHKAIKKTKFLTMFDAQLFDGHGGFAHIDCLVLFPVCIAVIGIKNFRGHILGDKDENGWVHSLGRTREAFLNPIAENEWLVKLVQSITGTQVPVLGHVLFVGGAKFPNGVPDAISALPEFLSHLRMAGKLPPLDETDDLRAAWERLARISGAASDAFVEQQANEKKGK